MSFFICQKDEICAECGDELPKGCRAYETDDEEVLCEPCKELKDEDN